MKSKRQPHGRGRPRTASPPNQKEVKYNKWLETKLNLEDRLDNGDFLRPEELKLYEELEKKLRVETMGAERDLSDRRLAEMSQERETQQLIQDMQLAEQRKASRAEELARLFEQRDSLQAILDEYDISEDERRRLQREKNRLDEQISASINTPMTHVIL
jgi:hypothetical protein